MRERERETERERAQGEICAHFPRPAARVTGASLRLLCSGADDASQRVCATGRRRRIRCAFGRRRRSSGLACPPAARLASVAQPVSGFLTLILGRALIESGRFNKTSSLLRSHAPQLCSIHLAALLHCSPASQPAERANKLASEQERERDRPTCRPALMRLDGRRRARKPGK